MKHLGFKFAMLSMVLVALVGCSKEQSSFNVEDVPGKAKVMGTLTYHAGYDQQGSKIVRDAANIRVAVLVTNDDLKSGSEGCTTYETVTDLKGKYSIEVPALDGGVNVQIIPDPFFESYSEVVNNVVSQEEVLYKVTPESRKVIPNDIQVWNGEYSKQ